MQRVRPYLVFLPFLPLLIFLIPDAMTFMPEPRDPWYTPYTTPIWFCAALYVYPVTAVFQLLGIEPRMPVLVLCWLVYAGILSYGMFRILYRNRRRSSGPGRAAEPTSH